jgi:hypothetical protein
MLSISSSGHLEPADYLWKQSRDSSTVWQRRALANEAMWLSRPKDSRELFLYASLVLKSSTLGSALSSAAKFAWKQLRYEVPELVLNSTCQRGWREFMQYKTPQTQEVSRWVERTSAFDFGQQCQDFEYLRTKILQKIRANDVDNVFLFLHAQVKDGNFVSVSSIQLMIYVDHQVTDGIGARILLGRYLLLLASSITNPADPPGCKFDWQESQNKLSSPWICLMDANQLLSGIKYNETTLRNQVILAERMVIWNPLRRLI